MSFPKQHGPFISELAPDAQGVTVLLLNHPPVNAFSPDVLSGLQSAVRSAEGNPAARALVLASARKGVFMAGADISHIRKLQLRSRSDAAGVQRDLARFCTDSNALMARIEGGRLPSVAAVDGLAFGGGCELAMACNARVASGRASFGLPELSLGIIPGFGGCQRLPRLVGLQTAVGATLSGRPFKADKAAKLGLVDEVAAGDVLARAKAVAAELAAGRRERRQALLLESRLGEAPEQVLAGARKQVASNRKTRGLPQYSAYLDAVEAGVRSGGAAGVRREIAIMSRLALSPTAKSLVHFFLSQRETAKVPGVTAGPGAPKRGGAGSFKVKTVAVLGGGTMGSGIAALCLLSGFRVILKEINDKFLAGGVKRVEKVLARAAKKKRMSPEQAAAVRARLTPQLTYDGFAEVDIVIEAAVEVLKIKQQIMLELERECNDRCILGTNTSTIDIDEIGSVTRPATRARILGLHYFAPAHVMPLLEVIRTDATSAQVLAATVDFCKRTRKTGVVVRNCVGFTANRAFFPYGQAAMLLTDAGVDPYRIDKALLKFGMPMGVFAMTDMSGADIAGKTTGTLNAAYGDRCYLTELVPALVADKRLGQKTGAGIYEYSSGRARPDPALKPYLERSRAAAARKIPQWPPADLVAALSDKDIVEMLLFPVANECFRILAEGMALRESDVDVVTVFGYGFPVWRGGVVFWAQEKGLDYVAVRLQAFADRWGKNSPALRRFFQPCDYLLQKAREQ